MLFLEACAHMEGFFNSNPNERPIRNNNPLDLTYNSETIRFGAIKGDPRFAVFPDVKTGWDAGRRWLSIPARFNDQRELIGGYLGADIKSVIFRFAPANENNSQEYTDYVCQQTGFKETDILTKEMLAVPNVNGNA